MKASPHTLAIALLLSLALAAHGQSNTAMADLARRARTELRTVGIETKAHYVARPIALVLDGRLDEWTTSNVMALDQPKDGTFAPPKEPDFLGYALVGWNPADPGRLYVAAAVVDDVSQDTNPADVGWFHDDTLEFLVDFRNEKQRSGALQHGAGLGGKDLSGACTAQNTVWAVRRDGALTVIELAIDYHLGNPYKPSAGLDFAPKPGDAIGFSIGFDDGEGGSRQSQWGWTAGTTWDPVNWGYVVFADSSGQVGTIAYPSPVTRALTVPPVPQSVPADEPVASTAQWVSVFGNDGDPGTTQRPLASIQRAVDRAPSGGTIYLKGGVYRLTQTVRLQASGTAEKPLRLTGAPGEVPILDFAGSAPGQRGVELMGSFWVIDGLVIQNAKDNGLYVQGSHNTLRRIVTRRNQDSGLQLHTGAANNTVVDCDSYYNYDPENHGENADGFAAKFGVGEGNVFRTSRAWNNSDDGWDLWQAGSGVTIEDSWSFENGYDFWNDTQYEGDGNGFKLGQQGGAHRLIRCVASGNHAHGFDVNGNTTGVTVLSSSAQANGSAGFHFDDERAHQLTNNLSQGDRVVIAPGVVGRNNSWDLGVAAAAGDFRSLDPAALRDARSPGGGLPRSGYLVPTPESPLVDRGVEAGLPYLGRAPDLGAFEAR